MKTYVKISILLVAVALIMLAFYAVQRVSAPESTIIAHERNAFYMARDRDRMEKDPSYAAEISERLQFLDLRTAAAYVAENEPDAAIAIVQKLITVETARAKSGMDGHSRNYANELRFYEILNDAYELKKDEEGAQKAREAYEALLLKAEEARKRKSREEGKQVGSPRD